MKSSERVELTSFCNKQEYSPMSSLVIPTMVKDGFLVSPFLCFPGIFVTFLPSLTLKEYHRMWGYNGG